MPSRLVDLNQMLDKHENGRVELVKDLVYYLPKRNSSAINS